MKFRLLTFSAAVCAALVLVGCGDRPGKDDEVLFNDAYPDLASVPEDKERSSGVGRQTRRLFNNFQAVPNDAVPLAAGLNPLLEQPVTPPRSIAETRGADDFNTLFLDNATATALLVRQQETDVFFGIEEQIAQDALQRARDEQQRRQQQEAREAALKEFRERREEQIRIMQERQEIQAVLTMEPEVEVVAGPQKQPGSLADLFFDTSVGDPVSIVYFDQDSSTLGEREMEILRPIAKVASLNNQIIVLHGHTNGYRFTRTQAHRDIHLAMSQKRAEAVEQALIGLGVPAASIETEWFGDLRPVWAEVDGMTSQGNRRVEIFVKIPSRLIRRGASLQGNT